MSVDLWHAWCLKKPEEGLGAPGTGVAGGCELLCMCAWNCPWVFCKRKCTEPLLQPSTMHLEPGSVLLKYKAGQAQWGAIVWKSGTYRQEDELVDIISMNNCPGPHDTHYPSSRVPPSIHPCGCLCILYDQQSFTNEAAGY